MDVNNRLLTATFLVLAILTFTPVAFSQCGEPGCGGRKSADVMCGPKCLLVVCQQFGVETTIDELAKLAEKNENGTTIAGLRRAAEEYGLKAVGMKIGVDQLASFKGPAIAHLWSNHFVVVEPGEADTIKVINPPEEPKSVKKDHFNKFYSGFALLIAKDASMFPIPKADGPDLRLDSYTWDFGSLYEGSIVGHIIKCRNVGNQELTISEVKTSCSCVLTQAWPTRLIPSGEGEIKLFLDSKNQSRKIVKTVYLTSNDPVSPALQVSVVGYVKSATLLTSLRSLSLDGRNRIGGESRQLHIVSTSDDPVVVKSVSSDSPYVNAELSESNDPLHPGYIVTASLRPGAPVGELKCNITILSDHPKHPKTEVPVTVVVKSDIDLDRDSFFLGIIKKGEEHKTTVTISTVGKDPLKIEKIKSSLRCLSVEVVPKTEGKEYVLTATLKPDAPLGNIKGEVTIHTNDPDQPVIKVPVYAYVEDRENVTTANKP